jgi:hypothetical protein
MQHHDGITATSKYHIEEMMKNRMIGLSEEILNTIAKLNKLPEKKCNFYGNVNRCTLEPFADKD